MKSNLKFWSCVLLIWIVATFIDRFWWNNFLGTPSWDQADYLNQALDHGRAMGLLPGGKWNGIQALLDLSPKIPPLASLVNGTIISLVGDHPNNASWSLSIWHGLLIFSIAGWGKYLKDNSFALLSISLIVVTPALMQIRSDYVLEMPLTASISFALWRLSCWLDPKTGNQWIQAILAAIGCLSSILIKQSALLILIPSLVIIFWIIIRRNQKTKYQFITVISLIAIGIYPWLKHNWITTISGTNRAVFESASREGDPNLFTIQNWIWYPKVIPTQIGLILIIIGLSGFFLLLIKDGVKNNIFMLTKHSGKRFGWKWLITSLIGSWIFTTISPNKDIRYLTPLIPSFILLISLGWLQWLNWMKLKFSKSSRIKLSFGIIFGYLLVIPNALYSQIEWLNKAHIGPIEQIISAAKIANPNNLKKTIIVVPSTPDMNQHNISYYGRRNGGNIIGRQLGNSRGDIQPVLNYGELILLAEGEQGSIRNTALILDKAVRESNLFIEINRFQRPEGGSYSLWQRKINPHNKISFAEKFPKLAMNLANGPEGLEIIFNQVAIQHMLDGHFEYQIPVKVLANKNLRINPKNIESNWTLALLAILQNRPLEAKKYFQNLEELLPNNPWPSSYLSIVMLANWNPWQATYIADKAYKVHNHPFLAGIRDLSGLIGGHIWRVFSASKTLPDAINSVIENPIHKSNLKRD